MKVVHVTPTYFSSDSVVGGGERFPIEIAKAMNRYIETTVLSFGTEAKMISLSDTVVMKVYANWFKKKRNNPVNLAFLKDALRADVIHCHQYLTLATNFSIIAGRLLGKKVFATDLGGGGWNLGLYMNMNEYDSLARWIPVNLAECGGVGGSLSLAHSYHLRRGRYRAL